MKQNLGRNSLPPLRPASFPTADEIVRQRANDRKGNGSLDVLLVNPPAPDGAIWIRSQHRVGRRSRENMIWPQVSLAQLAALLAPDYSVKIIDAIADRMSWKNFETILREENPRYYLTQVAAPTLTNDMYGCFLAKSMGATTMAFGTHVTPIPGQTLSSYPSLDYVLRGEPELILRELLDVLQVAEGKWIVNETGELCDVHDCEKLHQLDLMIKMWRDADPAWSPPWATDPEILPAMLRKIKGLVWRDCNEITINPDRPFIRDLDDLPIPLHHLLPWDKYRMPMIRGPYSFIVTSRGCPAGCTYCIKHVSYQYSVRLRSPEKIIEEMRVLINLGVKHIHMYADLFTVNRQQVADLCNLIIKNGLSITWTCNSRVDYVDDEMLQLMGQSGCTLISWGIESANEEILKRVHKGYRLDQVKQALLGAHKAKIKNWGYFIIGLPGETVNTIRQTIDLSKSLPLDIALFHIAAPYPGTPFFFDSIKNNWFRPGVNWEEIDMDQATVLDYGELKAEDLLFWQKKAFREWALRPGPMFTFIKSMNSWTGFLSAVDIALQAVGWVK